MPACFTQKRKAGRSCEDLTLKRLERIAGTGSPYPENADITSLPRKGQAWLSEDVRKQKWQDDFAQYEKKIRDGFTAPKERSWFTMEP